MAGRAVKRRRRKKRARSGRRLGAINFFIGSLDIIQIYNFSAIIKRRHFF
jgi:hypothetical protein